MQKKRGISLIVLVITIIVMIILAAAIILSLNNAGIIGNANKAVEMSNDKTIQTAADLKYAEYILKNDIIGNSTVGEWIKEELLKDNIIPVSEKDYYYVTDEGIVIKRSYYDKASYKKYVESLGFVLMEDALGDWERIKSKSLDEYLDIFANLNNEETDLWSGDVDGSIEDLHGKKLALPYNMKEVGEKFLELVYGYISDDIGEGYVTTIAIQATEIFIPYSVTAISEKAFEGVDTITKIYYSGNVTEGTPWGATNAIVIK